MNPYHELIRILNLSPAYSQGEWSFVYLLCRALGDNFSDSGNNVFTANPAKEVLRRVALIDKSGHAYQRLAVLLSPSVIAYEGRA